MNIKVMIKKYFILIMLLLAQGLFTKAQTNIPTLITSDQTWTPGGSPYVLSQNGRVDSGVTITILPGTIVKSKGSALFVDGSIEAKGSSTSKIHLDGLEIWLSSKSTDYDPITKKGCQFDYCVFNDSFTTFRSIVCPDADIIVTHSEFYNSSFGISDNVSNSKSKIIVDDCLFDFTSHPSGEQSVAIKAGAIDMDLTVLNSRFNHFYTVEAAGRVRFENNTFNDFNRVLFTTHAPGIISCNSFTNGQGITVVVNSNYDTTSVIKFQYNTLDTLGGTNGMLQINFYGDLSKKPKSTFNHNNILYHRMVHAEYRVLVYGANPDKLSSEILDFTSNFWRTLDSATIESDIRDYSDDAGVFAKANISNFATSRITPDCDLRKVCKAKFGYSVEVDTVTFMDSSAAANAYTRTWIYGDGSNGGHTFKKHLYNPGSYNACLAIEDNVTGCKDTFCTSITVKGKSSCTASYYFGIDTSNKFTVYLINDSKGMTSTTQYLWNFGDGNTSTLSKPNHTYKQLKKYRICLTLKDSAKNCFSTYCDSVGMDSLKQFLIGPGFNLNVINEWELTSIKNAEKFKFNIFPNPTTGKVFLDIEEGLRKKTSVIVMNPIGQVILNRSNYHKGFINLGDLPNGIYFIQVSNANGSGVVKVKLTK